MFSKSNIAKRDSLFLVYFLSFVVILASFILYLTIQDQKLLKDNNAIAEKYFKTVSAESTYKIYESYLRENMQASYIPKDYQDVTLRMKSNIEVIKPFNPSTYLGLVQRIDRLKNINDKYMSAKLNGEQGAESTNQFNRLAGEIETIFQNLNRSLSAEFQLVQLEVRVNNNLIFWAIGVLLVGTLMLSVLALYFYHNYRYKPLRKLINSAWEVSRGTSHKVHGADRGDEYGEIAAIINSLR
jgi:HAMP domain-containing protein